jgi:hypothetical protein
MPPSTAEHSDGKRASRALPALILVTGFIARLAQARAFFLNPDEALHVLLASQANLALTYRAALTAAHPPLLILVLHYWRFLGQSELVLRLPGVLAGTACAWLTYLWLEMVADRAAALVGLALVSFAPALIALSAEIRQYALLWFFMSACLYLGERALRERSARWMILFSLALLGALLSHYSSLIFAFAMGVYMLVRLRPYRETRHLLMVWAGGQVAAAGLVGYLFVKHVAPLRQSGLAQEIADTWLRKSIFHPGDTNAVFFVAAQTVRIFTFLLAHGIIGALTLLAFLAGVASLLRRDPPLRAAAGPRRRELALLLCLPFVVSCGAAIAGLYPYGGTRHSTVLALFGLSGAAIGVSAWWRSRERLKLLAVVACLVLCNLFPSPPPPIRPGDHARSLMGEAVLYLQRSVPPGSLLFTDYQSGLLLGYYACGHGVVQIFPAWHAFVRTDCGADSALTTQPGEWALYPKELPGQLAGLASAYKLAPGTTVWWFDAGWIARSAPRSPAEITRLGCEAPRFFGGNIFLCRLTLGAGAASPRKT